MTYEADELSSHDGQPIELYHFQGTLEDWYITSGAETITSNGNDYIPLEALERSALKIGTQEDEQLALDISIPFDHPLATAYAYRTSPPSLVLFLYRAHRNDPNDTILMWKGSVLSFSVQGRQCKMRVPAVFAYLLGGITPAPRYQAPCNHVLFDSRCAVSPVAHQIVTTVTDISNNIITVASMGALSSTDIIAGDMVWAAGGENRMMISAIGLDITVTYPFAGLSIGQSITLRRGCDHSFATCKAVFSNGVNFGGHPIVPSKNPFTSKP